MDESQKQRAADWINTHVGPLCPSCHQAIGFSIIEDVVTPVVMKNNAFTFGPLAIPLVGLVCNHCFNVRFFSAVMMGVVPSSAPGSPPPG